MVCSLEGCFNSTMELVHTCTCTCNRIRSLCVDMYVCMYASFLSLCLSLSLSPPVPAAAYPWSQSTLYLQFTCTSIGTFFACIFPEGVHSMYYGLHTTYPHVRSQTIMNAHNGQLAIAMVIAQCASLLLLALVSLSSPVLATLQKGWWPRCNVLLMHS